MLIRFQCLDTVSWVSKGYLACKKVASPNLEDFHRELWGTLLSR